MRIISTLAGNSFATVLRDARERTIDPTTGRAYTQIRLGELLGVSDSLISKWEHGEGVPAPELANEIAKYLDVTVAALVEAIGFALERTALTAEERLLLAAFRRLPPDHRQVTIGQVRTAAELLRRRGQGLDVDLEEEN